MFSASQSISISKVSVMKYSLINIAANICFKGMQKITAYAYSKRYHYKRVFLIIILIYIKNVTLEHASLIYRSNHLDRRELKVVSHLLQREYSNDYRPGNPLRSLLPIFTLLFKFYLKNYTEKQSISLLHCAWSKDKMWMKSLLYR